MSENLKIVIPMAGWGTRIRPHTWSKPKPLINVAGKAALDHLLDMFHTLPEPKKVEYVFIVTPFLGEEQIPAHMHRHHPDLKVHYVVQSVMRGQSDALYLARQYLQGKMLMVFTDTLIETDFGFLAKDTSDGVAWVKSIPDPRRFGVAKLNEEGWVTQLIEKPRSLENNLAVVGCYYFRSGEALVSAIEEQVKRGTALKGEYFLADAINIMLERGARMRTHQVDVWLDTGTIDATLVTNKYLLEHGRDNTNDVKLNDCKVFPPVFVHPSAEVRASTIGPHASIGERCSITGCHIKDSIIEEEADVETVALSASIIGRRARVKGRGVEAGAFELNIGDDSSVFGLPDK